MKRKTLYRFGGAAMAVVGVFLARGAQAAPTIHGDTTISFDGLNLANGNQIPNNYGSQQSPTNSPSLGITFGSAGLGKGTPDISLGWSFRPGVGRGGQPTDFQYYTGGPNNWNLALLNNSDIGHEFDIVFSATPLSLVELLSFDFVPYSSTSGTFNYSVTVEDASTLAVLSTQNVSLDSSVTSSLTVNLNVTGDLNEPLMLQLIRTGGTGSPFDTGIDNVHFLEVTPEPSVAALLTLGIAGYGFVARRRTMRG